MAHKFAEADIGDHEEIGEGFFEGANRSLDDTVFGIGLGSDGVFDGGDSEEEDGVDAVGVSVGGLLEDGVFGELGDSWHTGDGSGGGDFFGDEEGEDEIVWGEMDFADEGAESWGGAESAWAFY
jgi:hypothetical protein